MYKYQCSKNECQCTWTLPEGSLNGFVLTCPICGKGRGVFVEQIKTNEVKYMPVLIEEMTIAINPSNAALSLDDLNIRIDEFGEKHSLNIIDKKVDMGSKEILCTIKYRIKTRGCA